MSRPLVSSVFAAVVALAPVRSALADDGFAGFWKGFVAAVEKNDAAAVGAMVTFPLSVGGDAVQASGFPAAYSKLFRAKVRSCMVKAKPLFDKGGEGPSYFVFCDKQIYLFRPIGGRWAFAEIGVDD